LLGLFRLLACLSKNAQNNFLVGCISSELSLKLWFVYLSPPSDLATLRPSEVSFAILLTVCLNSVDPGLGGSRHYRPRRQYLQLLHCGSSETLGTMVVSLVIIGQVPIINRNRMQGRMYWFCTCKFTKPHDKSEGNIPFGSVKKGSYFFTSCLLGFPRQRFQTSV
jgi:hypothetical protein